MIHQARIVRVGALLRGAAVSGGWRSFPEFLQTVPRDIVAANRCRINAPEKVFCYTRRLERKDDRGTNRRQPDAGRLGWAAT